MTDRNQNVALTGVGLTINGQSNVIVRNLKISKVLADNGDAITIQASKNVWVDHVDLSSDLDHDKDYYDGLVDVTHASEWVTISNSYIHDHVSVGNRLVREREIPCYSSSLRGETILTRILSVQYKASLVGHSDSNSAEDTGHLHVTYANNYWSNINSRAPSFRFGTGHIFK